MIFNSFEFLIFLPTVFVAYWFLSKKKKLKAQNLLILLSSYLFYGWWDYRFLTLIILSTSFDYFIGLKLANQDSEKIRKLLLFSSIFFNLSVLGFFKYYNFFVDSWSALIYGNTEFKESMSLNIILPVGISFYTFQTMSYTIDIFKRKLIPSKDFVSFAAFVSFFPQLVAGPIERASNLLPQILNDRKFNYNQSINGLRLIIWGLFKKVVIADSLAPMVNNIFDQYQNFNGGTLLLGAIYFAFQIYCDFSGYSDIAIGTSKLFGIELISNFKFPYFSRNIGEFWRRWHISLSTWFRDYLYIPLGGSREGIWNSIKNIFIIFIVSGFWHGANWTFVFWGLFHAMLFLPSFLTKNNRKYQANIVAENTLLPSLKEFFEILSTFTLVVIGWVFFRSETIIDSFHYLERLIFRFRFPEQFFSGLIFIVPLIFIDYYLRGNERILKMSTNKAINYVIAQIFIGLTLWFISKPNKIDFIYFQF